MDTIPTNVSIFSPRGFVPTVPEPGTAVQVVAGSVWGTDDVATLRTAGVVHVVPPPQDASVQHLSWARAGSVVPGAALGPVDLTVRTTAWLALAGVPVSSARLPMAVRERLHPDLLHLMDGLDARLVDRPDERELTSMALRRCARALVGRLDEFDPPEVTVLLPEGKLGPTLRADLDTQTWSRAVLCPVRDEEAAEAVLARAQEQGVLYCTRLDPRLRYGPHHLAELVDALRHTGARVAHSPPRFRPWRADTWLEDESQGIEGPSRRGLPGGSLWYAADGPTAPESEEGYAVHGANAVPTSDVAVARKVALRFHLRRPLVLGWLPDDAGSLQPSVDEPLPRSYFATEEER